MSVCVGQLWRPSRPHRTPYVEQLARTMPYNEHYVKKIYATELNIIFYIQKWLRSACAETVTQFQVRTGPFNQFPIIVYDLFSLCYDAINLITNSLLLLHCIPSRTQALFRLSAFGVLKTLTHLYIYTRVCIGAIHMTSVIQVTWFAVLAIIAVLH